VSSNLPVIRNLHLFHISITFHGELDTENIQKTFSKAIDWNHYMANCWLVLTNSDAERWYARLNPLLGDRDTIMICEVLPETVSGWMPRWFIDWITQARERIEKSKTATTGD
jgi:hypothetical protein